MKKLRIFFKPFFLNLILISFLILKSSFVFSKEIKGKVIKVIDGDTIVVRTAQSKKLKVRLAGIDAPEKNQFFGDKSGEYLKKIIFEKIVRVNILDKDKYRRSVGLVFHKKNNINLNLVRTGNAWAYRKYLRILGRKLEEAFIRAESKAQFEKIGLWKDLTPTPPWIWRKNKKK